MKTKLSKQVIDRLAYTEQGAQAYIVRDAVQRNLFLIVGRRTKTFTVQLDVRDSDGARHSVRRSLGQWEQGLTVESARQDAQAALAEIAATAGGVSAAGGMTLRQAWALFDGSIIRRGPHRGSHRNEKTRALHKQIVNGGYLNDWMDRPLRSITRAETRLRHQQLTRDIAEGRYVGEKKRGAKRPKDTGQTQANRVFALVHAIWNRAMLEDESLPVCPVINVEWNKLTPPRSAIPAALLPTWWRGVQQVANPVRRDYLIFLLLSGMRREAACAMRWEDVDLPHAVLHVPLPKGGAERAFDLPLSKPLVKLLRTRQKENTLLAEQQVVPATALGWCWPSYSATGHINDPREEIPGVRFSVHDLRRTFSTVAEGCDVSPYALKVLLNHKQPGGTTGGYLRLETERLRAPMETIAVKMLALCKA